MSFSRFIVHARSTECHVEDLPVDAGLLSSLTEIACSVAALLDLYNKSLYLQQPIQTNLLEAGFERARKSLSSLPGNAEPDTSGGINCRLLLALFGIFTEAGELLDAIGSAISGEPLDGTHLREELGDLNWYQAIALDELGTSLETILEMNVAKLRARYPKRFTVAHSVDRDRTAERAILEARDPHLPHEQRSS